MLSLCILYVGLVIISVALTPSPGQNFLLVWTSQVDQTGWLALSLRGFLSVSWCQDYRVCHNDWLLLLLFQGLNSGPHGCEAISRAQEFLTKIKCSSRTSYLLCFLSLICALNPTLRLYEPFSSSIVEGFLTLRNLILLETYNSFKDVSSL